MNKIKRFATYNETTSWLRIDGGKLSNDDVGFYTIAVSATFSNGTHSTVVTDKFRLEVRAKPAVKPPVVDPSKPG